MNKLNLYNIGDSNETYIALLSCITREQILGILIS